MRAEDQKLPNLRRYIISPVLEQPGPSRPAFEGIGELWFDTAAAGQAALDSREGQAVVSHMSDFVDMERFVLLVAEEEVITAGKGAAGASA